MNWFCLKTGWIGLGSTGNGIILLELRTTPNHNQISWSNTLQSNSFGLGRDGPGRAEPPWELIVCGIKTMHEKNLRNFGEKIGRSLGNFWKSEAPIWLSLGVSLVIHSVRWKCLPGSLVYSLEEPRAGSGYVVLNLTTLLLKNPCGSLLVHLPALAIACPVIKPQGAVAKSHVSRLVSFKARNRGQVKITFTIDESEWKRQICPNVGVPKYFLNATLKSSMTKQLGSNRILLTDITANETELAITKPAAIHESDDVASSVPAAKAVKKIPAIQTVIPTD